MTELNSAQNSAQKISPNVAKRAVEWLMEWQSADEDEAEQIWQLISTWRQAQPEHNQAWLHIEQMNKKFGMLSTPQNSYIAHNALVSEHENTGISRRDSLKVLSVLFTVGGSAWLVNQQKPWQNWLADYQTNVGEQQHITLVDGTQVTLNTDTAINIHYTTNSRTIVLVKGEIYVKSAHKAQYKQPLTISVAQGYVQPIGTRFTVRQTTNKTHVAVFNGNVKIQPKDNLQHVILIENSRLTFTKKDCSQIHVVSESAAAWTQGMIVVSDMRLEDFLLELNRYRRGIIQCAPDIANLKVSGTYPINQAEEVLHTLTYALPIQLRSYTQYWVKVLPKP